VLPILLIASLATIQFGIALVVSQAVTHAATVGAREAAKMADTGGVGVDMDELVCVVESVLGTHGITIGTDASVVLEDPTGSNPIEQRGTLVCNPPSTPVPQSSEVRVTVCVDLGKKPFLNCLTVFGLDFSGRRFTASSLLRKEIAG